MGSNRKYAVWVVGVIAAILCTESVAWGCTRFVGDFTVTGNHSTSGTVTSKGTDAVTAGFGNGLQALVNGGGSGFAVARSVLGTASISTGLSGAVPASTFDGHAAIPGGQTLPAGAYNVVFLPGAIYTSHYFDGTVVGYADVLATTGNVTYNGDGDDTVGTTNVGDWQYGQTFITPDCFQLSTLGGGIPPQVTLNGTDPLSGANGGLGNGVLLGSVHINASGNINAVNAQLTVGGTAVGAAVQPVTFGLPPMAPLTPVGAGPVIIPEHVSPFNGITVAGYAPAYAPESAICLSSSSLDIPSLTGSGGFAQSAPIGFALGN